MPKRPKDPSPQHTTSLRSRITQVCAAPTLIALAVRPAPRSTFGNDAPISPASSPREFSFPLPKRPLPPAPQHCTAPLDNSTQLWASPAAIATTRTPALSPSDTAGRASPISPAPSPRALVSPKPSWPSSLRPQHFTASLSSTTQVCAAPVASNLAVRPVPRSTAGKPSPIDAVVRPMSVVAPEPSRPLSLSPKHFTLALSSTAHVCRLPADTARTLRPAPRLTAAKASPISLAASPSAAVPPEPICPAVFAPKHFNSPPLSTAQVCASPASRYLANAAI